jgi:RHS repeat-associated protein
MPMLARLQKPAAWRDRGPVGSMTSGTRNRPPSVTVSVNNKRTCSVYGVDGTRLKKIENLAANANCAALPTTAVATVYFGAVEVRNWQVPGQEVVLTYPSPAVKLTNGVASYLHRDHLGSVRAITDAVGARVESAVYKPFGEQTEFVTPGLTAPESKGWIGERYDADAGLQYLNARYYDPVLGMFLQPDWWEVLKPGVGTNRFSYSFNDPVNFGDPNGNVRGNYSSPDGAVRQMATGGPTTGIEQGMRLVFTTHEATQMINRVIVLAGSEYTVRHLIKMQMGPESTTGKLATGRCHRPKFQSACWNDSMTI